ncbi:AN1-type zinc finger protein 5 isoform X1 [Hydra vulgaris]|uniref:AN1-type zinc finger protein 5 n=1 Tax=Hydra vulgaris TaxID=6087 RepID=T2MIH9_HYDVU|nr:AN1-type zinc finger protein 5 isoform X2 [Hydra vulgaris]
MEQDSNRTVLCKMGCGFYGNHSYEGMCSKCYRDHVKRQQQSSPSAGRNSPATGACGSTSASQLTLQSPSSTAVAQTTAFLDNSQLQSACLSPETSASLLVEDKSPSNQVEVFEENSECPGKIKKNRCCSCRKKVGLTGFECRCGGLFCGIHRYSDKHNCSYDYKADGREQIAKANPVIVGEKIKKI